MDSSSSSSSSTSDLEAGFSGCISCVPYHRAAMSGSSLPPPRPRRLFCYAFDDEDDDHCEPRHFLDSCSLCRKPLARNRDIFMYRGDTPFCSEECRQERIEIDEAKEKSWKLSAKASSATKGQGQQQNSAKSQKIHVRASTAVAG